MATTEHAITISEQMELPSLPPNQGLEAMKDIIFGSVRSTWHMHVGNPDADYLSSRQEWPANSSSTRSTPSRSDYNHNPHISLSDIQGLWIVSANPSELTASEGYTEALVHQ